MENREVSEQIFGWNSTALSLSKLNAYWEIEKTKIIKQIKLYGDKLNTAC